MAKFRKRPVVIEAVRCSPEMRGLPGVMLDPERNQPFVVSANGDRSYLKAGDWIIPEPLAPGRFYGCDAETFARNYEPADTMRPVAEIGAELLAAVEAIGSAREASLARTKIEEALMWAERVKR